MIRIRLQLLVVCLLSAYAMTAQTVHTVCNLSDCPASYASVADALSSAVAGDVIHILPSPIGYGDVTVDKAVTLLGSGHAVDGFTGLKPILGVVTVNSDDVVIASMELQSVKLGSGLASVIEGVEVRNNRFYGAGKFIECNIAGGGTKNWVIEGNVFTPDAPPNSRPIITVSNRDTTWDIRNNYIEQFWPYQRVIEGATPASATATHLFRNNVVYASGASAFVLSSALNFSVHSNIFWVADPAYTFLPAGSTQWLHFQSNVLYSPAGSLTDPDPTYGNTVDVDPAFEHLESGLPEWDYGNAFELASTSSVSNAGLGGQEPGLYGNAFMFSMSGHAAGLPRFTSVNKAYEILPAGEILQLEVEWNAGE